MGYHYTGCFLVHSKLICWIVQSGIFLRGEKWSHKYLHIFICLLRASSGFSKNAFWGSDTPSANEKISQHMLQYQLLNNSYKIHHSKLIYEELLRSLDPVLPAQTRGCWTLLFPADNCKAVALDWHCRACMQCVATAGTSCILSAVMSTACTEHL